MNNKVYVGIKREDYSQWERRTLIIPDHIH